MHSINEQMIHFSEKYAYWGYKSNFHDFSNLSDFLFDLVGAIDFMEAVEYYSSYLEMIAKGD